MAPHAHVGAVPVPLVPRGTVGMDRAPTWAPDPGNERASMVTPTWARYPCRSFHVGPWGRYSDTATSSTTGSEPQPSTSRCSRKSHCLPEMPRGGRRMEKET